MAILKNTDIRDTQYFKIPVGNNSQRPSPATAGMIRYNTDSGLVEEWSGSAWVNYTDYQVSQPAVEYFTAIGSHTFAVPTGVTQVEVLVVGGGGGGGSLGGGGGAGGLLHRQEFPVTPGGTVPVTVGAGGTGGPADPATRAGQNSSFGPLVAFGGAGGSSHPGQPIGQGPSLGPPANPGNAAGSGGGASYTCPAGWHPGTAGQGYRGGDTGGSPPHACSGGGGAGGHGGTGQGGHAGEGGMGRQIGITGNPAWYAGGGGGGSHGPVSGAGRGGTGGGGGGARNNSNPYGYHRQFQSGDSSDGAPGTGGGGGASGHNGGFPYGNGGKGGPGIVIVRY
jgi:hypothetical protein